MKYPKHQFLQLVEVLKQLKEHFEITENSLNRLHYIAYQQTQSKGFDHNHFYIHSSTEKIVRKYQIEDNYNNNFTGFKKLVNVDFELELYPNNCNDTNILTAMKKAVKMI